MTRRSTWNDRRQSHTTDGIKPTPWDGSPLAQRKMRFIFSLICGLLIVSIALKSYETSTTVDGKTELENVAAAGIDDANIFFTYARHLARGEGAVYNVGGERVEGFSSPLFTLLCTGILYVTQHVEVMVLLVNTALLVTVMVQVQYYLQASVCDSDLSADGNKKDPSPGRSKSSWGWCCSAWLWVWIVGSPQFVIWTTITLMDVGLWTCVFVLGSLATVKAISWIPKRMGEDRSVMLWIGLMSLTRSEGLYLCLIWIAVLGWGRWRRHGPYSRSVRDRLRSIGGPVLTYLGVNFCVIGIRYWYFGYPFPNTYYAKVSPELFYNLKLGVGYAWLFIKFQPWVIPCIGLVFWQASQFIRGQGYRESDSHAVTPQQSSDAALAVITLLALVCPVLTGGDHFDYARFFQPCWPLLGLVGIGAFGKLMMSWKFTESGMNAKSVSLVLVLAVALLLVQKPSWVEMLQTRGHDTQMRHDFVLALRGRELGHLLNGFSSRLEKSDRAGELYLQPMSLGTLTTGGVGYTYTGPKFDVLGLNDVRMAHRSGDRRGNKNHAAFDKNVFLQRMPDMFAAKPVQKLPRDGRHIFPSQDSFWQESLLQLDKDPRFLKSYTPVAIRLYVRHASSQKLAIPMITAWLRTDFLNQIRHDTSSYTIEVLP